MPRGNLTPEQIRAMGARAVAPGADHYQVAVDAMRVGPQLTEGDLRVAQAFGITPFAVLAARLAEKDAVAAEREERARSAEFHESYRRRQGEWGLAEIERLRNT